MKHSHWFQSAATILPRRFRRNAALAAFRLIDACRFTPQHYVLALSHMRAGSTLLVHLLATSRAIISAGERNVPIATEQDLWTLAVQAYWINRSCRPRRYVADQINHMHLTPADSILQQKNLRFIVLIREPQGAIASMVNVLGRYYDFDKEKAFAYYRARLPELARLARRVSECSFAPALYLTYDQLINSTAAALTALANFLHLDDHLSEEYPLRPYTGRHGDPSQTILSGRVLRQPSRPEVVGEFSGIAELKHLYDNTLQELAGYCLGIADAEVAGELPHDLR